MRKDSAVPARPLRQPILMIPSSRMSKVLTPPETVIPLFQRH